MNVIILGGFLGSGKTTALMQFARYLTDISDPNRKMKVVIIENEIGEVGIDDQFLRGGGFTVDNLFAGCACCTVSGELVTSLLQIQSEMDPEWMIIETTGIAFPKSMQENLKEAIDMDSVITVLVDASRWMRLRKPMASLLNDQLKGSHTVLINKIDLVTEDILLEVENDIQGLEPGANTIRISAASEVPKEIWRKVAGLE